MTDEPLETSLSSEEINYFRTEMENPDSLLLSEIGSYILNVPMSDFKDTPYRGKIFYELVYNSLRDWERFMVDKVTSREEESYMLSAIREEYSLHMKSNRFGGNNLVENFFRIYVDKDGEIMATTKRDTFDIEIIPESKYKPLPDGGDFSTIDIFQ